MPFAISPFPLSKAFRCISPATHKLCQVIRSAAPVTQNHLSKPEDLMLQSGTLLRKSAPWPDTAPATENASLQIFFKCPTPANVFGHATKPSRFAHFDKVHNPSRLPHETTSEPSKLVQARAVFQHFELEMCFALQRHALFRHLNFQKCSEAEVFCAFLTSTPQRPVLFSTSQLPKVHRGWGALYILTWKGASRHNSVHFFQHLNFQKCSEPVRSVLHPYCRKFDF